MCAPIEKDAENLEFHKQVLDAIEREGALAHIRPDALATVDGWEAEGACGTDHIDLWRRVLSLPVEEMRAVVLDETEQGVAMRRNSPFGDFARQMVIALKVMERDHEALAALAKL